MKQPRVLMADDHSIMLAGVRKLIEDRCDVVGTVEDGRALLEAAERLKPDLILLDITMPLLNGLDAARQLKKSHPDVKNSCFSRCMRVHGMPLKPSKPGGTAIS